MRISDHALLNKINWLPTTISDCFKIKLFYSIFTRVRICLMVNLRKSQGKDAIKKSERMVPKAWM